MLPLVFFSYLWKLISEFKAIEKYRSAASKISAMVQVRNAERLV
jgi:hypothetical protein